MESTQETEIVDDKNIITDIAFGVDDTLLGKPLATPLRRGVAVSIDAFLVLMLTHVSAVFAAFTAGLFMFKVGKKSEQKRWRFLRFLLRMTGATFVFVCVIVILNNTFNDENDPLDKDSHNQTQVINSLKLVPFVINLAFAIESGDCDQACYTPKIKDFLDAMALQNVSEDVLEEAITDITEELPFNSKQARVTYQNQLRMYYQSKLTTNKSGVEVDSALVDEKDNETQLPKAHTYSLLELTKGIIADLGLGFGWAALYFTAFPAWWRGQTPGKKLMGIRVIQLDGSYMSAWESFGRYGGYGAGFATGLLGFLQIYWDSNRQAIQDKISATVVIKGNL